MKKIVLSTLMATCILFTLPSHTAVTTTKALKPTTLYQVSINLIGPNGGPGNLSDFRFYAYDAVTWEFFAFDDCEEVYLLPAGTYYFGGQDGTGSGWCGIGGTQATISSNTSVTMRVWCE